DGDVRGDRRLPGSGRGQRDGAAAGRADREARGRGERARPGILREVDLGADGRVLEPGRAVVDVHVRREGVNLADAVRGLERADLDVGVDVRLDRVARVLPRAVGLDGELRRAVDRERRRRVAGDLAGGRRAEGDRALAVRVRIRAGARA